MFWTLRLSVNFLVIFVILCDKFILACSEEEALSFCGGFVYFSSRIAEIFGGLNFCLMVKF